MNTASTFFQKGQSLIEILIAIAVGVIMLLGAIMIISPALRSTAQVEQTQTASALGKALLDDVSVFAEANWHNIDSLATSSANLYFLNAAGSPFFAATGTEGVVPNAAAISGLVGYWNLDETAGSSTYDSSGYNDTGTFSPSIPAATSSCFAGGCRSFNGTNNYVSVPDAAVLNPTSTISLSAWVKPAVIPQANYAYVVNKYMNLALSNQYALSATSDGKGWQFCIADVVSEHCLQTSSMSSGWTHLAGTYDGTTEKFYVNGALVETQNLSISIVTSANPVRIGSPNGTQQFFQGTIDEVRIYNRALSAQEVTAIYNARAYTRSFYVSSVNRDASPDPRIVSSGGTLDPSTRLITVKYAWPTGSSTISEYLTRSRDNVFNQTDWTGGGNFSGPYSTSTTKFASSTNIDFGTPGQISLILPSVVSSTALVMQSARNHADSACTISFPNNTAGDLIIVAAAIDNGVISLSAPTDTVGNVYQLAAGPTHYLQIGETLGIWYAADIAGTAATNTVNLDTSGWGGECLATEYSGLDTAPPLDGGTSGIASSSALVSGNITTANARDLLYGFGVINTTGRPLSVGANYTARDTLPAGVGEALSEDRTVSATGTYNATENGAGSAGWIMGIAAFKIQ